MPCKYPIKIKGHCCPSCTVCPYADADEHDEIELDSESNGGDPCLRCYCVKGQMLCHRNTCPVLPCSPEHQVKALNACCPVCLQNKRKLLSNENENELCRTETATYHEGQKIKLDKCTECLCTNATLICMKRACHDQQECLNVPDECCPQCSTTLNVSHRKKVTQDCRYNDKYYKVSSFSIVQFSFEH